MVYTIFGLVRGEAVAEEEAAGTAMREEASAWRGV